MPRRTEPRNPVVVNSSNEFSEVGYSTGGTPMPVNLVAGGPSGGTIDCVYICGGTVAYLGTLGTVNYVQNLGTVYYVRNVGTVYYVDNIYWLDTLNYQGTLGTVNVVQQLGTLHAVAYGTFSYRPPTTLVCGTKKVAGTASPETLAGATTIWNSVIIQALYSNTGTVFLKCGTATPLGGIAMVARDVATVVIDDLAKVYVEVTVAGEGVAYLGS